MDATSNILYLTFSQLLKAGFFWINAEAALSRIGSSAKFYGNTIQNLVSVCLLNLTCVHHEPGVEEDGFLKAFRFQLGFNAYGCEM
jgi:hypothetical protein